MGNWKEKNPVKSILGTICSKVILSTLMEMNIMEFEGKWYIEEMELWGEDYINMEVKAYIQIYEDESGDFQFGLVSGGIKGKVVNHDGRERFEFRFNGMDEMDPISGEGWIERMGEDVVEGKFIFDHGDSSMFTGKSANE